MTEPALPFDRPLHRKRLNRAAAGFAQADFLKDRAAQDQILRLGAIMRQFGVAVDLGARSGCFARLLASEPDVAAKVGLLIQTDLCPAMLSGSNEPRLVMDEERNVFAPQSLDLVVSSLALHWVNDLVGTLIQIRQSLRPDGLFLGALFGGLTLTELRQSLLAAEDEVLGGAQSRVSPFLDTPDGAALLQRAGFALPVSDVDRVTVRYDHPLLLMRDLRAMGETSALLDRSPRALRRDVLTRACEIYQHRFSDPDGRIRASFEIISLTGWAPADSQQKPLRPGSAKMRLADALGSVEQSTGVKPGG
jgi:SAM-dependent methyltransferase